MSWLVLETERYEGNGVGGGGMNYDTMSAHELVLELQESMRQAVIKWKPVNLNQRAELESALRRVVIREASVGVVKLSHNGVASDYDLIPREVK